jgi:lysophospholipase L1-like esterase
VGDSVAWGYGVSDQQSAAWLLNEDAAANGWQVQNLGVSGYGLGQINLHLGRSLPLLPDLRRVVVLLTAGNDLQDTGSNARYGKRKPMYTLRGDELSLQGVPIRRYCLKNLISRSAVVNILYRTLPPAAWAMDVAVGDVRMEPEQAKRVTAALLERIATLVAGLGAELEVILAPTRRDFEHESQELQWFREALRTQGIAALDLLSEFERRGLNTSELFLDEFHLTPLGNELLAELVHERWPLVNSQESQRQGASVLRPMAPEVRVPDSR